LNKKLVGPIKGNGITSVSVNLNINNAIINNFSNYFKNGIGYLRFSVEVQENYSSDVSREGKGNAVVKIISSGSNILAYPAKVTGSSPDEKVALDTSYYPICQKPNTNDQDPICPVIKNDIIGLTINDKQDLQNFSWTINGQPLTCDSSISTSCSSDGKQNEINFFPVTDDPGATYIITLNADNIKSGKSVQMIRKFEVVEPFVKIVSTDEGAAWPKYLGDYTDLSGNRFQDKSDTLFETNLGSSPVMKAEFHPLWLGYSIADNLLQLEWVVDGKTVAGSSSSIADPVITGTSYPTQQITVPSDPDKGVGSAYNIVLKSVLKSPLEKRRILKNLWKVSQFDSTEKYLANTAQIEITSQGEESEYLTLDSSKKILASLFLNLPSQIVFLLRIILTIAVILLVTSIVFSLTPKAYEDEKN